jgi:hypothetical protein
MEYLFYSDIYLCNITARIQYNILNVRVAFTMHVDLHREGKNLVVKSKICCYAGEVHCLIFRGKINQKVSGWYHQNIKTWKIFYITTICFSSKP